MTAHDGRTFLRSFLSRVYQTRYLWLHVVLAGGFVLLRYPTSGGWMNSIALAAGAYAGLLGFALYGALGWTLRTHEEVAVLPSVLFIAGCFELDALLSFVGTPGYFQRYWTGLIVLPILGVPTLFVFLKLWRGMWALTDAGRRMDDRIDRLRRALSRVRNPE